MTDNGKYNNKEVAKKLEATASRLDEASKKLEATASRLAHSIASMNSERLVSPPQLHLPSPSLRPLASTPTSNSRPISVSGESSIATLPRNATHEEQKAHAEYMSRNYEPDVEYLRDALALANRNSFSRDDTTYRDPKHNHSRSRLGGKKITNKTKNERTRRARNRTRRARNRTKASGLLNVAVQQHR